jgi:hypothetical protein
MLARHLEDDAAQWTGQTGPTNILISWSKRAKALLDQQAS